MGQRIGLLGGTFDPPHLGHLIVAEEARVSLGLDEVRLLVAGAPWMKPDVGRAEHRTAMCRAAVADAPHLTVDDREVRREGLTYTADTLEELHEEQPRVEWFFVAGADALAQIADWERAARAVELATFVAVPRPGSGLPTGEALLDDVIVLDVPALAISSTDIRARVRAGRAVRYQVPDGVLRYIREHGLYRSAHGD